MTESVFLSHIAVAPAFRLIGLLFAIFSRKGAAVTHCGHFLPATDGSEKTVSARELVLSNSNR